MMLPYLPIHLGDFVGAHVGKCGISTERLGYCRASRGCVWVFVDVDQFISVLGTRDTLQKIPGN